MYANHVLANMYPEHNFVPLNFRESLLLYCGWSDLEMTTMEICWRHEEYSKYELTIMREAAPVLRSQHKWCRENSLADQPWEKKLIRDGRGILTMLHLRLSASAYFFVDKSIAWWYGP